MKANILVRRAVLSAMCVALAGCATATQNESVGTALGAVIGGVIGNRMGGKQGTVVGAALGAALGNQIGKHLDVKDRQKLAEARQKAVEQQSVQSFYASSANANIVVTPSASYYQPSPKQFALASDVHRVEVVETSGDVSVAMLDIPVYSSADFSASPKLTIPRGARISKIAVVRADPNWVLVGDRDFAIGYVPAIYFDPEVAAKLSSATNAERVAAEKPPGKAQAKASSTRPTTSAPANAPSSKTDALLSANSSYVPPPAHMRQIPVSQDDLRKVVDTGNRSAQTKSGGVSFIAPVVECKDLTSVLLTNNQETGREVTKSCRKPGAGWM